MKSIENWNEHILSWQESGLSQKAYCEKEMLSYNSFQYNLRKYENQSNPKKSKFNSVGFLDDEFLTKPIDSDLFSLRITTQGEFQINLSFGFSLW